jgi:hypothetical protein
MNRPIALRAPWGRWTSLEAPPTATGHVHRLVGVGGPLAGHSVALHTWGAQPTVPTELLMPEGGRYELVATYQWRPPTSRPADLPEER